MKWQDTTCLNVSQHHRKTGIERTEREIDMESYLYKSFSQNMIVSDSVITYIHSSVSSYMVWYGSMF